MDLSLISAESQRSKSRGEKHLVTFRIGDVSLGLPVRQISGFIELVPVTPVPLAPSFVAGVFEWRGQTVTQIDLAERLGLSGVGTGHGQIVLIVAADEDVYGFPVDSVQAFLTTDEGTMNKPSESEAKQYGLLCTDVFHYREARYPVLKPRRIGSTDDSGIPDKHHNQVPDIRESTASSSVPKLRLVSSNLPPMAAETNSSKETNNHALLHDLGGRDGIRRLADGIAFRILDDDSLNPFLGTLDAQQLPDLIARYLTGLVVGQSDNEVAPIVIRLLAGDVRSPQHAEKSLAHIGNALFTAGFSTGVTDEVLHRLESALAASSNRPSGH